MRDVPVGYRDLTLREDLFSIAIAPSHVAKSHVGFCSLMFSMVKTLHLLSITSTAL